MFRIASILSLLCLPLALGGGAWQEFISYEGGFRLSVPGGMKEVVNRAETSIGTLDYHIFALQDTDADAENHMYMVSYCDYPEGSVHSDSVELVGEFLDATIESAVESVRGELVYAAKTQLNGYPGRVWRTDYGGGKGVIRTRAFVVGRRYYSVQTACHAERSLNPAADRFMDSFRLLTDMERANAPKGKKGFKFGKTGDN